MSTSRDTSLNVIRYRRTFTNFVHLVFQNIIVFQFKCHSCVFFKISFTSLNSSTHGHGVSRRCRVLRRMAPSVGRRGTGAVVGGRAATAGCARLDPGSPLPRCCNSAHKKITSEGNLSLSLSFNDHPLSLKSQILVNASAPPNEAVSLSYARIVWRSRPLSNL